MSKKAQIPLSFPVRHNYDPHDYIVLPCNEEAVQWVERYPDWPYPVFIVYGESGSGKTHLIHKWQARVDELHRTEDMAIDNADKIFGDPEAEQTLFHQINQAKEKLSYIILTMTNKIAMQEVGLPDLRSRLMAAPQVEIQAPEEVSIETILVKLFHDRQLSVEPGVINYILPRIERSFTAVQALVQRIDESSLAEKRSVTVPLVRGLLSVEN